MRVAFDTNVVLDLLLDREPWSLAAARLFSRVEGGELEGYVCATTITTIHYLATKAVGSKQAREEILKLLTLCAVAPVDQRVLQRAVELDFSDFEDAVIHEACRLAAVDVLVTQDLEGFKRATVRTLSPEEFLSVLEQREATTAPEATDD